MKRKVGAPKPAQPKVRERRRTTVPREKYAALPSAFSKGKFLAASEQRVYLWRVLAAEKPSWHICRVVRAAPDLVELWDETRDQWFCFNPQAPVVPDVRMEGLPKAQEKTGAAETVATTAEETKSGEG